MASIPPHEQRTQTTIIYFKDTKALYPLLSPLSATNLRLSLITAHTSRSQRRAALKPGATDVLLVSDELRGLNIKTATHIINYELLIDETLKPKKKRSYVRPEKLLQFV
jgi:superfamily II DNA/RNA helicase